MAVAASRRRGGEFLSAAGVESLKRASGRPCERSEPNPRLARARRLLERYELRQGRWGRGRRCLTGLVELDRALGGGVPLGVVCEVVPSGGGLGAVSLALEMARTAAGSTGAILLIDLRGDFYPPAVVRLGVGLRRLVIVCPQRWTEATWAMEQALRCGSVSAVVGLFALFDARSCRRLQLAAEAGGGIGLLVHEDSEGISAKFAAVRMRVEGAEDYRDSLTSRVTARRVRVRLLKGQPGMSTGSLVVELGDAASDVPVHALSGDGLGGVQRWAAG